MANTSSRTLRLLSLLQTHRFWPGPELADRLEVSARTLRRDVDRLRELGYPVDAAPRRRGRLPARRGRRAAPAGDRRRRGRRAGRRHAGGGAGRGARHRGGRGAGADEGDPGDAAAAAPPGGGPACGHHGAHRGTPPRRSTRTSSPRSRRPAATTSASSSATPPTRATGPTRLAEPHRLVPLGRRWYLVAYDLHRHDWRSFRLDRIDGPAPHRRPLPAPHTADGRRRPVRARGHPQHPGDLPRRGAGARPGRAAAPAAGSVGRDHRGGRRRPASCA